jgi:hypothetical protein
MAYRDPAEGDVLARIGVKLTPGGGARMWDQSDPDGPVLVFTAAEWEAFLAGARAGEFDEPSGPGVLGPR